MLYALHFLCGSGISRAPALSAQSAVLVCEGEVLYEKNARLRLPMASTTKIMTAILAIENANTEDIVSIKSEHCMVEGSSMYLRPESEKTVLELLKGLLLVSGNDAALALADHVAGDCDKFVEMMNRKAADLGLENTHFTNPHGLSHASHYTTAYDLALLMEYCMDNELFRRIVAMKSFESDGAQLLNHNKLLFSCPGCIGGKTGYTEASGRCLVSCCEREGAQVICVTLSAPDDWNDHMSLYNWVYDNFSLRSLTENQSFPVPLVSNEKSYVFLVPEKEESSFVRDSSEIRLEAQLPWFAVEPLKAGDRGGKVSIFVDGIKTGEYYLIYSE
ncbi:MAG: D-alanyl-D-alanine carboxypeptidase [Oscillospiraceae bacterium]|nr:D-alanyl-D-alanine carboxypeptidase [Oscillospiraceae bacterium]